MMANPYVCIYACLTFDCLQQVGLSCSAQREMEKRDRWIKSEMSPLWNLPLQGWIPYWGPQALSSSQPILCAHICVCACVSGGKPMVLVLLSFSSVSLASYLQPPTCSCFSACTVSQPPGTVHEPHSSVFGKTKLEDTASTVQSGQFAIRDIQIWDLKPKKCTKPVISPQLIFFHQNAAMLVLILVFRL